MEDSASLPTPELKARLARFHERVETALKQSPASRDWVQQALRRQGNGRCPVSLNRISPNLIDEAHRLGLQVFFHSDGNVMSIVDDLIEIGLDVLDPLQPGAMDYRRVAATYGGRVSFSGAIDLQYLLSRGTPAQIRSEIRQLKKTLGQPWGGGYVVSPSNIVGPEVPLPNLEAMFQAAHES